MNEVVNMDWYISLKSDLDGIKTQLIKEAREATMRVAWMMGKRILEERENLTSTFGAGYVSRVAQDIGVSDSTIRNSERFAEKFPEFEDVYKLKEGENISLHKIVHGYLYEPSEQKSVTCEIINCPVCGKSTIHKKV